MNKRDLIKLVIFVILLGVVAVLYSYSRVQIMAKSDTCLRAMPPCAVTVIPPTFLELITGSTGINLPWYSKPRLIPMNYPPCDQSGTTSDCSGQDSSSSSITPNQIGGIYHSSDFGISFHYPAGLFVEEGKGWVTVTSIPPNDPRRQSDAMMGSLSFSLIEGKTLKEAKEALAEGTLSSREVSFNGYKAIELTSVPDGFAGSTWISILTKTNKGILNIQYAKYSDYAEIYHSIIESVRI